jgi:hypothetical protein
MSPARTYGARLMRPVAYVCMRDPAARARFIGVLERNNYAVIPQPTGFHLIRAIAGVIEGQQTWLEPTLIVVDRWAPGCAGTTIAEGLRELGITIPVVLVDGETLTLCVDERDGGADRDRLAIDHVRAVSPLLHRAQDVAVVGSESRRA